MTSHARKGWVAVCGVALVLALAGYVRAQTVANTPQERAAIELVRQWFAAWQTGDPDKIASATIVGDNIVFQGTPTEPVRMGRAALRKHVARLRGAKSIEVTQATAIGGSSGTTVVLLKRNLTLSINGNEITTPIAALVRVEGGKVQEWRDYLIEPLGPARGGRPGAPGGPPPGRQ
ncbi:MAG TPA: nuclear transport factor 2 family protein [Bryobacteraceae bacterium]|nr:nuclear transport factor 2 family protein [Bryobacteraceae bacterium]